MQLTPEEISRLSPKERLDLIDQLWESLDASAIPIPPLQQAELARRLANLDDDRSQTVTWESLKADLAQRCP